MQAVGVQTLKTTFTRKLLSKQASGTKLYFQAASKSSSNRDYFKDPGAPKVAVCKDGQTIAMYHPVPVIDYDKTIPISREDPRYSEHQNLDGLVLQKLRESNTADKPVQTPRVEHGWPLYDKDVTPAVMELAEMFHTSKHMWYAKGSNKNRRRKQTVNHPFNER
uniref:Large ribosomal subunit protein mL42 n=1 Tax=Phallusia mammillata TaxID=59560 RepID=A0A6F9DLG5_9ASCI|nr:39S ribosomal protein L42, mitochondrial-like [Phallusia mammillata]